MFLRILDRIRDQFSTELPFVAYRKPGEPEVRAIFQQDRQVHTVTDFSESGFVFAPFDLADPVVLIKADESLVGTYDLQPVGAAPDRKVSLGEEGRAVHLRLVQKGITEIWEGHLEKVVLARVIDVAASKSPLDLYLDILDRYPLAFCYLWYHPEIGLWLGATPEMLLETENQRLRTMSLAGTQPYRENEVPVWSPKEEEEQGMVTRFIIDSLADKVSHLQVSGTTSSRAGNLWHLRTLISGVLEQDGLGKVIEALHPTPAVGGLPKAAAQEFIVRNEGRPREYYTGFLGELNFKKATHRAAKRRNEENRAYRTITNKTSLYVNLRCMKYVGDQVAIYVGGGITKDSVPEMEWEETQDKARTMLNVVLG